MTDFYYSALIPVLAALLSALLASWLTEQHLKKELVCKFKEQKYSELMFLLQAFFSNSKNNEMRQEFYNELYRSRIYASDDVLKKINLFFDWFDSNGGNPNNGPNGQKLIGELCLLMRNELLGKTSLVASDFKYFYNKN